MKTVLSGSMMDRPVQLIGLARCPPEVTAGVYILLMYEVTEELEMYTVGIVIHNQYAVNHGREAQLSLNKEESVTNYISI
jgi:hypothetical protein